MATSLTIHNLLDFFAQVGMRKRKLKIVEDIRFALDQKHAISFTNFLAEKIISKYY